MNGDGFADLAVGAAGAGTASIFLGSADGLSTAPHVVLEGVSVASAGDVNGDGFADLVVGAPVVSGAGTASIFYGSAAGLSTTPDRVLAGVAADDRFGRSVASAGDVNGDGFADLVVGAQYADPDGRTNAGTASIFYGSAAGLSATPAHVLAGVAAQDWFGESVASAGDVNGDGFADIAVGAQRANPEGRRNAGTASIFYGSAAGISAMPGRVLAGVATLDGFGRSVACADDVNGDGFADLVVGAPSAMPNGLVRVGSASIFYGSAAGISATPARVLAGVAERDNFGVSVASAGDANGDGFADLVVGAYLADPDGRTDAGTASIFYGSAAGPSTTPDRVIAGGASRDWFGLSASAGDVNGDGFADLVVGARLARSGGVTNAGTASIFYGSAAGLPTTPHRVLGGVAEGDYFGDSVATR